jgi:hypothetical protein
MHSPTIAVPDPRNAMSRHRRTLTLLGVAAATALAPTGALARPIYDATAPAAVAASRPPAANDGFNWADGAIGAGATAVLLLSAAGLASARRPAIAARRAS